MRMATAARVAVPLVIVSAFTGLLRDVFIAARFGASTATDAFFFSYDLIIRFPEFVIPAVAAALVPRYVARRGAGAASLVWSSFTWLAAASVGIGVVIVIFAPAISTLFGDFGPDEIAEATTILRLLGPLVAVVSIAGLSKALLEAEGRFLAAQVSTSFPALGVIGGVLLLSTRLGSHSLAWGLLAGGIAQFTWLMIRANRQGVYRREGLDSLWLSKEFRLALWPGLIGALLLWAVPLVDKLLAAGIESGAITQLVYGGRPISLVERVSIHAVAGIGLSVFSWSAQSTKRNLSREVQNTIEALIFLLAPVSVVLIVLRGEIIGLLYERGQFTADAAASSAGVLAVGAAGLLPMALAVMLSTAFKATGDTRTPAVYGAGGSLVAKCVFALLLVRPLGIFGLAMSSSLMYVASCLLLLLKTDRAGLDLALGRLGKRALVALALASVAIVPGVWLASPSMPDWAVILLVSTVTGVLYLAFAFASQSQELAFVRRRIEERRATARASGESPIDRRSE